jgi:hypothetical protein
MNDPQAEGHMASHLERRKFLATLGGAAVAWPLTARAQQREKMRRVGVLMTLAADDPEGLARVTAFAQGSGVDQRIADQTRYVRKNRKAENKSIISRSSRRRETDTG